MSRQVWERRDKVSEVRDDRLVQSSFSCASVFKVPSVYDETYSPSVCFWAL